MTNPAAPLPAIRICYCPKCNWMLRSAWMAQEILQSFSEHIQSVALCPSHDIPGLFEIYVDSARIWCRKSDGGFPNPTQLKQRVRDLVDPERDLGHHDRGGATER